MAILLLLAGLLAATAADNSFVVVSPNLVSPGRPLRFAVTALNVSEPIQVEAALVNDLWINYPYYHYRHEDRVLSETSTTFSTRDHVILTLDVPHNLTSDIYYLKVTVSSGIRVEEKKLTLNYYSKSLSTFIQTDKSMYKPGQTVHLRVLAVDPELKTYTGPVDVSIIDPNNNKIKQWLGVRGAMGVFSADHKLSSMPVLGSWKVRAQVDQQPSQEVTFEVLNYQLPLYEVTVELPSIVLTSDKEVKGKVKATYTYGEPVKGIVEVQASLGTFNSFSSCSSNQQRILMTYPLDGEGKFTIPMEEIQRLNNYLNGQTLTVQAFVTETLTGKKLNGSSAVKFYSQAYQVQFSAHNPSSFKPALKYSGIVHLSQVDGRPVPGGPHNLTIYPCVTYNTKQSNQNRYRGCSSSFSGTYGLKEQTVTTDVTGLATFHLDVPADAVEVSVSAFYQDVSDVTSLKRAYSPSESYLQVELPKDNATAGEVLDIVVKTTSAGHDYFYQVSSRGLFVTSGRIPASGGINSTMKLHVTPDMAPHARLLVYYVTDDGEVVVDNVGFDVSGVFANKVSLSFSQNSSQPGEQVQVLVQSDAHSLVALLAVDQSVSLLAHPNDISRQTVEEELRYYDLRGLTQGGADTTDATQVFWKAGLQVYTDATLPTNPGGTVFGHTVDSTHPTYAALSTLAFMPMMPTAPPGIIMGGPFPGMTPAPFIMPTAAPAVGMNVLPTPTPQLVAVTHTRKFFPETWLWTNTTTDDSGKGAVTATVPDTITSWVASAFAVSPSSGLGVSEQSPHLKVFRPFFVSLDLPLTVVRGEQVVVHADVFNYMKQDVDVVVMLPHSDEYDHLVYTASSDKLTVAMGDQSHSLHVPAGEARAVSFAIAPKVLGRVDLTVSARSTLAADAVSRQLDVIAEGVEKETNSVVMLDLLSSNHFRTAVNVTLPPHVVPGSVRGRIRTYGDVLSPSITGLDSLLELPTGCGEQNMLKFAPDIYISQYLTATKQFTGQVEAKVIPYLEEGFQRELTYQRWDGSFSAFGDNDYYGSTWLTAFVVKSLVQAKQFIFVDNATIARGVNWLLQRQSSDGSFREDGHVLDHLMQGGSGQGFALTAYILSALYETRGLGGVNEDSLDRVIQEARANLEFNIANFPDAYTTAVAAYALARVGSHFADDAFLRMEHEASKQGDLTFWQASKPDTVSGSWWTPRNRRSSALDIEATAYALLTYSERQDFARGLPALKWLTQQRNPHGGFVSTQDTVVSLEAMARFATVINSDSYHVGVDVTISGSSMHFDVTRQNALDLQGQDVDGELKGNAAISATGHGLAYVELSAFFHVDQQVERPSFDVTTDVELEALNTFTLRTCVSYVRSGSTGMAVLEVAMPSGFHADRETVKDVRGLKRVEERGTSLVLYLDNVDHGQTCVRVTARRTDMVAANKPSFVRVYRYYEPQQQGLAFYHSDLLSKTTVCDVCPTCCPKARKAR